MPPGTTKQSIAASGGRGMTIDTRATSAPAGAEQRSRRLARRRVAAVVFRSMIATTLLMVGYYALPLDRPATTGTVVVLVIGLLGVAALLGFQLMQVVRSDYPRLRAVGVLGTTIPLFLLLFSASYYLIGQANADAFSEALTRTDALYFTVTVFSTVGFGDIAPKTEIARIVAMMQMIGDLVLIGIIGRLLLNAVSAGVRRKATDPPSSTATPARPAAEAEASVSVIEI